MPPEPDDGAEDELRPELELDFCERDECEAELDLCVDEPELPDPDEPDPDEPDPDELVPREAECCAAWCEADDAWALAVPGST